MKTLLTLLVAVALPAVALAAAPTPQQVQVQHQRYMANQQALYVSQHKGFGPTSLELTSPRQAIAYGYRLQPDLRRIFNQK